VCVQEGHGQTVRLVLGPLTYDYVPADRWAAERTLGLREEVVQGASAGAPVSRTAPARRCLLLRRAPAAGDRALAIAGELPTDVAAVCPPDAPETGWAFSFDALRTATWWHPHSRVCIMAVPPDSAPCPLVLPWLVIVRDVLALGGAIVHAGVAVRNGGAALFLAQAGGGKSTALRRLPAPWRVLGDDAALVWPADGPGRVGAEQAVGAQETGGASGEWLASPLPTWGYLLGRGESVPGLAPWRLGECAPVRLAVVLRKAGQLGLTALRPADAVRPFYLGAAEYSAVFTTRRVFARELFAVAAALARDVPTATLAAPKGSEYWPLVAAAMA
jgi:hypothetical protein